MLSPIQALKADTSMDALNTAQQQPKQKAERKLPMLSLISSAVAIQAQTQRFEMLAGRSAMVRLSGTSSSLCAHIAAKVVAFVVITKL